VIYCRYKSLIHSKNAKNSGYKSIALGGDTVEGLVARVGATTVGGDAVGDNAGVTTLGYTAT